MIHDSKNTLFTQILLITTEFKINAKKYFKIL